VVGKQRCKLHGGASTGPTGGHGIYRTTYTADELATLSDVATATLSDELILARVRLRRLLEVAPPPVGQGSDIVDSHKVDWWGLFDRLTGRIGRLAEQHARTDELSRLAEELQTLLDERDQQ
jgi:hypothetical protein